MKEPNEFRCGPLRLSEWEGFWKASPNASPMTEDEWDRQWDSLRAWLSQRYLIEWTLDWQTHCCVEGDYAEPERTLRILIEVAEVLTVGFLEFVQEWLRKEGHLWRIAIPTDNTSENLIIVYPEAIRINPNAEMDLERFVRDVRPSLALVIENGLKQFGLRRRPHPPLPPGP